MIIDYLHDEELISDEEEDVSLTSIKRLELEEQAKKKERQS